MTFKIVRFSFIHFFASPKKRIKKRSLLRGCVKLLFVKPDSLKQKVIS
jgi:hypothetical protein